MFFTLALITSTVSGPTPQCEYYRYMTAAIWSAVDDAERAKASKLVIGNLENTLRDAVAKERRECSK